jgi:hypothetical protein
MPAANVFVVQRLPDVILLRAYDTGQCLSPAPMGLHEKAGVVLLRPSKPRPAPFAMALSGPALAALLSLV